jgi:hypothetical protein
MQRHQAREIEQCGSLDVLLIDPKGNASQSAGFQERHQIGHSLTNAADR